MKSRPVKIFPIPILIGLLIIPVFFPFYSLAATREDCIDKIESGVELSLSELAECEAKLEEAKRETIAQGKSLESEIKRFDTSIAVTAGRILETSESIKKLEREINGLSTKIDRLDTSLDQVSKMLIKRISETYKKGYIDPLSLFFSSGNLSEFIGRYKYLRAAQLHDRELMTQMESTKTSYEDQKTLKEQKQTELEVLDKKLEGQKLALAQQKQDRELLLVMTRNDERRYQSLLEKAREEREAILNILAGKGEEEEAGSVGEGERIASIIQSSSCNSSGPHLHFMVAEGEATHNPFNYLQGGADFENCSGTSCGSGDGDSFNPSGSWSWPISPPIEFTQGYGATWATKHTWVGKIYDFHNGIDINSASSEVKAVKAGKLYRGSYVGSGGCRLPYVRVDHDDSGLNSYYLHVNY